VTSIFPAAVLRSGAERVDDGHGHERRARRDEVFLTFEEVTGRCSRR
jgi:hypothetical protein